MSTDELERLVGFALRAYQSHPEWEDIRSEGRLGGLRALAVADGRFRPSTLVTNAARADALDYLRSTRCHPSHRVYRYESTPRVSWCPLEEESTPADDFTAAILDQMEARSIMLLARHSCTQAQWDCIRLTVLEGHTHKQAGQISGRATGTVSVLVHNGLRNIRQALKKVGEPERWCIDCVQRRNE